MFKNIIISALVAAVVATGVLALFPAHSGIGLVPSYQATLANQTSFVSAKQTVNTFSLGGITVSTSSATTTIPLSKGLNWGLALGDQCAVELTTATSTLGFSADGYITSIGTSNATVTVTFFNGANAAQTFATGTMKVNCQHY